jgi:hypothetical protein
MLIKHLCIKTHAPPLRADCKINPLNAELNPICHFLALLGAHHILHVSRIRVKDFIRLRHVRDIILILISLYLNLFSYQKLHKYFEASSQ